MSFARPVLAATSTAGRSLRILGLLVAFFATACVSHPAHVLFPAAVTTPAASQVTMLIATTRATSTVPGEWFSGARGADLGFAELRISIPPDSNRTVGEIQWPARLPANPAKDFNTTEVRLIPREEIRAYAYGQLASHDGRVLLFVHGFNNRFQDAVYRFAQITHDAGINDFPVLFTWPSQGKLLAYMYDRESANYSRDQLEHILRVMIASPRVKEINILAHSMGGWLTMEAVRQLAIRDGTISPKLKNIMLAAPDIDVDVFRGQFLAMGSKRPQITLFVSHDDRALAVSKRIWRSTDRVGSIDPNAPAYRERIERAQINVVDLSELRTAGAMHHAKFAESPEIVRLIGTRLAQGQDISGTKPTLGENIAFIAAGAGAAVGGAAGAVIGAPVQP